ncbi:LapA family protein [Oleiagrimonas sp.]|jgi:putative membrane protein|uniref:LapA family protein n=1 Tax=Oleiagrimonas sp. TaxID=2010330 RepID=UPI0026089F41|nr:LapA family protein [Oleiagrimonas sp.]MDA3913944.1 LapA family protein [Oleiagrimonas sp.]
MRYLILLLLLVCLALGVVFGALNAELVGLDFGFVRLNLPIGASLLSAVILGWLLGGFTAWWGVNARHRRSRRGRDRKPRSPTPDA